MDSEIASTRSLALVHTKRTPHRCTLSPPTTNATPLIHHREEKMKTTTRVSSTTLSVQVGSSTPVTTLVIWRDCRMHMVASCAGRIRRQQRGGACLRVIQAYMDLGGCTHIDTLQEQDCVHACSCAFACAPRERAHDPVRCWSPPHLAIAAHGARMKTRRERC
jgi:hypothetical protein